MELIRKNISTMCLPSFLMRNGPGVRLHWRNIFPGLRRPRRNVNEKSHRIWIVSHTRWDFNIHRLFTAYEEPTYCPSTMSINYSNEAKTGRSRPLLLNSFFLHIHRLSIVYPLTSLCALRKYFATHSNIHFRLLMLVSLIVLPRKTFLSRII